MVDEASLVAVHGRVDYHVIVDGEEERVVALALDLGVSRVRFGGREPFAGVLD
jgi:hypothetical protein